MSTLTVGRLLVALNATVDRNVNSRILAALKATVDRIANSDS